MLSYALIACSSSKAALNSAHASSVFSSLVMIFSDVASIACDSPECSGIFLVGSGLRALFLFFGESAVVITGLFGSPGDPCRSRTKLHLTVNIDSQSRHECSPGDSQCGDDNTTLGQ